METQKIQKKNSSVSQNKFLGLREVEKLAYWQAAMTNQIID